jgi:signal transduction histidine kinase
VRRSARSSQTVVSAAASVREISKTTSEALGETRLLLFELRPPPLEEHELGAERRGGTPRAESAPGAGTRVHVEVPR